jgi:hypothetical protein
MNSFDITDTGKFVKALLSEDFFAKTLLYYAEIKGACRIEIDGRLNKDFYDSDDEGLTTAGGKELGYIRWGNIRNQFFEAIRGSRLPLRFSVSLVMDQDFIYDFVASSGISVRPDEVESLNINIMYDRERLTITTGNSYKIFTLDKSLDTIWDSFVHNTFKELDIL